MPKERQTNFSGGELDPELYGRVDLPVYAGGAQTLKNFIVTPRGAITNRPGFQHVGAGPVAIDGGGEMRLVPFVYDESTVYLLVFSAQSYGCQIAIYKEPASPRMSMATQTLWLSQNEVPYASGDLAGLRFAQVGNLLTITSPNHTPHVLRRTSDAVWSITEIDYSVRPFPYQENDSVDTEFRQFGSAFTAAYSREFPAFWSQESDSSHPSRWWEWAISFVMRNSDGEVYETQAQPIIHRWIGPLGWGSSTTWRHHWSVDNQNIVVYPDRPVVVFTTRKGDTASNNDGRNQGSGGANTDTVVSSRIYRGREGRYGFVGETTAEHFEDDGAVPDFSTPPRTGVSPFEIDGSFDNPSVVTHYQGRRYFGGVSGRPNTVFGSAIEDWDNFEEVIPPDAGDPVEVSIRSNVNEFIRAIIPFSGLLVLTSGGEWLVRGASGPIAPGDVVSNRVSKHGCGALEPVQVSDAVFFLQLKGGIPKALQLDQQGNPRSLDLSVASGHLFDNRTIVDWAWSESPFSCLWVVMSDGALLSMTYVPEHSLIAWARHELAGSGLAKNVAVIPSGTEDRVYVAVTRAGETSYSIECLAWRNFTDVRHAIFLDRSKSYDGTQASGTSITIDDQYSTNGDLGDDVQVTGSGVTLAVGQVLQVDNDDGESYRLLLTVDNGGNAFRAQVLCSTVAALFDVAQTTWYICSDTIGGLHWLEGQTVTVVADGNVVTGVVVSGASVDLTDITDDEGGAAIAHVGLPYNSDFESMDIAQDRQRQKTVQKVLLELNGARGGQVGNTFDNLTTIRNRTVSDGYKALAATRRTPEVMITNKWENTGRVVFRQNEPMPVTIVGITREVKYGGT